MMCRHIDLGMAKPTGSLLTEENLRLHSTTHMKPSNIIEASHNNVALSDDGDFDAMRDIALQRAASLEALQAYGGCFVSGFLAMQEPLPWISTVTAQSTSNRSIASSGSPRPDSDTLSHTDAQEATVERKRSWRSLTRLRSAGRKSK